MTIHNAEKEEYYSMRPDPNRCSRSLETESKNASLGSKYQSSLELPGPSIVLTDDEQSWFSASREFYKYNLSNDHFLQKTARGIMGVLINLVAY